MLNRQAERLRDAGSPLLDAYARAAAGCDVHETRTLGELAAAASRIRARGADVVVLAGGDGSAMAGVTAILAAFGEADAPAFALAPGGTVSTVARNWGMRGSRVRAAARLLSALRAGRTRTTVRPTLRVRDDGGDGERVGFIFGAGLVASFFREYYASPRRGTLAAARIVAPIFAGSFTGSALARRVLEPAPCRLTVDGAVQPAPGYGLVAASVVRDLGLHMLVTYRAGETFDRFHAIASPLGTRALGPQMPRVLLGRRLRGEGHVDTLARDIELDFRADGAYVLDGELIEARRVGVTAGPPIRVVGPD